MATLKTPTQALFTYPDYGQPVGFPELVKRSGSVVTVVNPLRGVDGLLYRIRFDDGYEHAAFPDELTEAN